MSDKKGRDLCTVAKHLYSVSKMLAAREHECQRLTTKTVMGKSGCGETRSMNKPMGAGGSRIMQVD